MLKDIENKCWNYCKNKIEQMKNEINSLSKMDMINYLNHMMGKKLEQEKAENEVNDESTID